MSNRGFNPAPHFYQFAEQNFSATSGARGRLDNYPVIYNMYVVWRKFNINKIENSTYIKKKENNNINNNNNNIILEFSTELFVQKQNEHIVFK